MLRRLIPLNGLAIIAVVVNHAGVWGYTAMFWMADRYRMVEVPNFDQIGSPAYYLLLLTRRLTLFSVPVFLVTSGVFISYFGQSGKTGSSWKALKARLGALLIPYFLWSIAAFVGRAALGSTLQPLEYVERLLLGRAAGPYYYVIVVCQLYFLAPIVTKLAATRWKLLLVTAIAIHLIIEALDYGASKTSQIVPVPTWLALKWFLFFVIGVIIGIHREAFPTWLRQHRGVIFVALLVLVPLTLVEGHSTFIRTGLPRVGFSLVSAIYALCFIFWWLSMEGKPGPLLRVLQPLGTRTYGIFLIHALVLEFVNKALDHFAPGVLGIQALYQPLLIVAGMCVPLIMMLFVRQARLSGTYNYLFG